jgi:Protein kinase domain
VATTLVGRMLGKTLITDLLGHGGMATVYKGYQQEIDRYVAVKVLPPHPGQDVGFVDRFKLEARTIARLQHPHILPVYDYGNEDDILYLVMAFVPGGSLAELIAQGPLPLERVSRVLREIAPALDYAHRQSVIHRDIKPGNILLDKEGNALLADFGIVKLLEGGSGMTSTGGVVGTPAYMAPEQANGQPVDGRTDIYALGVVVFEMLSGNQPFSAETPVQLLLKHLTEPAPSIRDRVAGIPHSIDAVIHRALAKDPSARYQSATDFANDFNEALRTGDASTLDLTKPLPSMTKTGDAVPRPTSPNMRTEMVAEAPQVVTQTVLPAPRSSVLPTLVMGLAAIGALLVAVLALITANDRNAVVAATATPTAAPTQAPTQVVQALPSFGSVRFSNQGAIGDTIVIQAEQMGLPASSSEYVVWLQNTDADTVLRLGVLDVDALGSGSLQFTSPDGKCLPALYNRLLITEETEETDAPSEAVAYSGSVPIEVTQALNAILWASEDGINGGSLLDGALTEAGIGRQHTGLAANADNIGGLRLHAEHSINIFLGTNDDFDGDGRGQNPGRGIGVVFFLDKIAEQLNAAANAADATVQLQSQIEFIRVCVDNARLRLDEVIALERELIAASDLESVTAQRDASTEVARAIIEGVDLNGNDAVEPFEGECGLEQIGANGILVASFNLQEGAGE